MSSPRTLAAAIVFLASLAVSVVAAWLGHEQLVRRADDELALAARLAAARVESEFVSRMRALEAAAGADTRAAPPDAIAARRAATIGTLVRLYPELVWVGFVDGSGRVRAAHRGLLEGADVSGRDWWRSGMRGPYLGGAHDALMLADLLRTGDGGAPTGPAPRLLDMVVPLRDGAGAPHGVLAAHLDERWLQRLRDALRESLHDHDEIDVLMVQRDGSTATGRAVTGIERRTTPGDAVAPVRGAVDGIPRVIAVANVDGDVVVSRLGWSVALARPIRDHQEHARSLALGVLATGAFFGALAGLAAARVLRPRPAP